MAQARVMVCMPGRTGIPEDVFVNTLYFQMGSDAYGDLISSATTILPNVWNDVHAPGVAALGAYYSRFINPSMCTFRFYRMDAPEPRVPHIEAWTKVAGEGATYDLPEEVSLCASYHAAPPITPRRRGRIYLGPLNSKGLDFEAEPGIGPSRPTAPFQNAISGAMKYLCTAMGAAGFPWLLHSTRAGAAGAGGTNTENYQVITGGYVDNAWDTQRRRGVDPTTRVTWEL